MNDMTSTASNVVDTGDSLTVSFVDPISINGKTYDSITVEEPTGNMVERAELELKDGVTVYSLRRFQLTLVHQSAGVPREVIGKMKISQVQQAADFLAKFTALGRLTGETSSET